MAPAWRARGIGGRVLRTLLNHGRGLGCRQAWVLTARDNAPGVGLYRSVGGQEAETAIFTVDLTGPA